MSTKHFDRSMKLYEVLLEEYERLEILEPEKADKIKQKLRSEFSGLDWHDFAMNDWIQAQRLKRIRRELLDRQTAGSNKILSPSALCFSGGGIRSATFSLGVLQALAKYGLLDKFDYLSTVSGGGYIGSWLSAWIDRAGSVEKVQAALCRDEICPFLFELKDFAIDFDNALESLEKLPNPLGIGDSGLNENAKKTITEFFEYIDELRSAYKEKIEIPQPENFEIKIIFKAFVKSINRLILANRKIKREQTIELSQELTPGSIKSIDQIRSELELALSPILRVPALLRLEEINNKFDRQKLESILSETKSQIEKQESILTKSQNQLNNARTKFESAGSELEKEKFRQDFTRAEDSIRETEKALNRLNASRDFLKELLNVESLKSQNSGGADFRELLLAEFNSRIEKGKTNLERIKERKKIRDHLAEIIAKYSEGDLLQNAETANTTPEPEEITHLRTYSNYMSPKLGLFSTDSFSLFTLYLRNLLLNWLVFVPLIAAFLLIPKLYLSVAGYKRIILEKPDAAGAAASVGGSSWKLFGYSVPPEFSVGVIVMLIVAVLGVMMINKFRPSLSDLSFFKQNYSQDEIGAVKTAEGKILALCILPIMAAAFALPVFWLWTHPLGTSPEFTPWGFIVFGILIFSGGFLFARILLEINRARKFRPSEGWNIIKEFAISLVCGAFGGLVLHFGEEKSRLLIGGITDPIFADHIPAIYLTVAPVIFLTSFLLAATMFVGIASKITDDMDREWMNRFGALILKFVIGWLVIAAIVLYGHDLLNAVLNFNYVAEFLASLGGITGLLTLVLGFSSASTEEKKESENSIAKKVISYAPQIAAPLFMIFLIGLIAFLTARLMEYTDEYNPFRWFVIFAVIGGLAGWFININKFSLHAMYRERLIRTYLGASRLRDRFKTANSFTDLDERDNVEMKYLFQKPYHVINMTLNLVKAKNLRWQNRKAESFTSSALYCGSSNMGNGTGHFRSSAVYAGNQQLERAITLGTSMAVSGAAASPNMGYFTVSTAVSFLMTLFNVRLGWWFGNPGNQGKDTYMRASPDWSPRLLVAEAFSGTTDTYPYIYVSDGGHFENLGIYEMVLRRCRLIVAIDGTADPDYSYSDLGNAIHKIRVDMGVPIIFRKQPKEGVYCAVADIKYSDADGSEKSDDGILIYIKSTIRGDEPVDIRQYKVKNGLFPHESTVDQWYSETQFESYRGLGFHMVDKISSGPENLAPVCDKLSEFEKRATLFMNSEHERIEEEKAENCRVNDGAA